ncbi:hypothetical protein Hanom_Chr02g00145101 [Helianthus anomalus]
MEPFMFWSRLNLMADGVCHHQLTTGPQAPATPPAAGSGSEQPAQRWPGCFWLTKHLFTMQFQLSSYVPASSATVIIVDYFVKMYFSW